MAPIDRIPLHVTLLPALGIAAWLMIGKVGLGMLALVLAAVLLGNVIAAVYHAEVVALRMGEPYGTLVLALAVTVIEVGLIISIMLSGKPPARFRACRRHARLAWPRWPMHRRRRLPGTRIRVPGRRGQGVLSGADWLVMCRLLSGFGDPVELFHPFRHIFPQSGIVDLTSHSRG